LKSRNRTKSRPAPKARREVGAPIGIGIQCRRFVYSTAARTSQNQLLDATKQTERHRGADDDYSVETGVKNLERKETAMKRYRLLLLVVLCLSLVQATLAQTPPVTASALPRLVRFGGTVKDLSGSPLTGVVGITFALYSEQTGGAPLWLETQNITPDSNGRYTALMGATKPEGLPAHLFTNEQAHWVGVQVEGQPELPRVLLVSSPYALKAGDAETIGGLPPSAFVLAAPTAGSSATASSPAAITEASRDLGPATATDVTTTGGTANYLPIFTGTSTILDSVVYQSGTGGTAKVGINTSTPASTLDVKGAGIIRGALTLPATGAATATASYNSEPLNLSASVFNSGTGTAAGQTFQLKAEPVRNDTVTASGVLSVLYGSGANAPAETGLSIAGNGLISFATGQTFPGAGGTITGVTAGIDLTGGGTTGTVTLNVDTTKVPQLAAANTFTASQTVSGSVSATSFSGNGAALTSLQGANVQGAVATASNALNLGGFAPSAYQPAGSYATTGGNTFTGNQSVTGNVTATGSVSGAAATFTGLVTEAGALLPASGTATTAQGYNSQPLDSVTSAYNSSTASAQSQDFRWLAEPVGNDTSSPSGKLDLLFGANGAAPSETGLSIASNGVVTFASGQTFQGAGNGTITGVTAGTDLTGGGTTGTVTLNLDTTKVPQLAAANTFTASQTVNGGVTATSFSGNGSALTNLQGANVQGTVATASNALNLGGLAPGSYQPAGSYATTGSNTFTGNQSVTGNVTATGSLSGAAATFIGLVTEAGALLPASGTATTAQGYSSQPLDSVTSTYNSSTASAQNQDFRWLAEPVGNDTSSPSGKLDLLFGANGAAPGETGLSIASNGVISFVAGQPFPGAGGGTITGVSAGADLTGGGTTGTVTLNLDTTKVPQLAAANTFTAGQTVNGSVSATSFSGNGAALTSLQGANVQGAVATASNALNLGGFAPSAYQPAGSYATTGSNTFAGNQSVTGNVTATGSVSGAAATFTGLVTEAGALLPASGTATTAQGYNSQPLDSVTSAYNSSTASAQSQDFRWLAEPVGNDTSSPSGKLDLLFGANGASPAETGLWVGGNGVINFASGQTFPGAGSGTVTSVGSGAGLTGGPITSSGSLSIATGGVSNAMLTNPSLTVLAGTDLTGGGSVALGGSTTLNLDTTKVPQLNTGNTFSTSQTVNGTVTVTQFVSTVATGSAPLLVSSTTQVNNLNASLLGGLSAASFQPVGSYATLGANTFSATQSVSSGDVSISNGNLDLALTSGSGAGVVNMGGAPFIHSCCTVSNAFVGLTAGNLSSPGSANTGIGYRALNANSGGTSNTATGSYALQSNTTASGNTGDGYFALGDNSTGAENTAVGYQALADSNSDDNTAVGYYALRNDTSGTQNTALGQSAGSNNLSGSYNTFIGMSANAQDGLQFATAIGYAAYVAQSNSMVFGGQGSNSVRVGIGTSQPLASLHINNVITAPNLVLGQMNGTTVFRIDDSGAGWFDGGTHTGGADFAESVAVRGKRSEYEPGDLLVIDTAGRRRLALADKPYSTRVAGIYSTKPGVLATPHKMDDPATSEEIPLAVVGIVPCKVTAANGAIQVGDLLVASSLPGYAMKGRDRYRLVGAVVGKALEPLSQGKGVIQVLVTLQ
jgi:hypothetical protein